MAASFIKQRQLPCLWFQITATDSEPAAFFFHLSQAANVVIANSSKQLPQLTPELSENLPVFFRRYSDTLCSLLPKSCIIILDNFQELEKFSPINQLLPLLCDTLRPNQHLIGISREAPPKQLARLRVNQKLSVLDWHAVRFSNRECAEFLSSKGFSNPEIIQQITAASDGWAAGLILMQRTGKPFTLTEMKTADHQLIFDYFAEEALQAIPKDALNTITIAALFSEFSAATLASICDKREHDISLLLDGLYDRQFFIARHKSDSPIYQFHPMFRHYLLNECENRHTESELTTLRRKAAILAKNNGQIMDAAILMIKTESWKPLGEICIEHAVSLLRAGLHKDLLSWISVIPEQAIDQFSPWLWLHYGSAQLPSDPVSAMQKFETAYRLFSSQGDIHGRFMAWAAAVEGLSFSWDNFNGSGFWLDELESLLAIADYPSQETECRVNLALMALLIWSEGGIARFPKLADRCISLLSSIQNVAIKSMMAGSLLFYYTRSRGNLDGANLLIDEVHSEILNSDAPPVIKTFWYSQYLTHCCLTRKISSRKKETEEYLRIGNDSGIRVFESVATGQIALTHIREESNEVQTAINKLKVLKSPNRRIEQLLYYYVVAHQQIELDNYTAAQLVLEKAFQLSVETNAVLVQAFMADLMCYTNLQLGEYEKAQYFFDHLTQLAKKSGSNGLIFQSRLLEAQLSRYTGDTGKAKKLLENALRFARTNNTINVLDPTSGITSLYAFALEHSIEVDYVKKLISIFRLTPYPKLEIPMEWPWPVRVRVCGQLAIDISNTPIPVSTKQKKVLELLALLVVEHRRPISKNKIKQVLWSDTDDQKAEQNLKSTLTRLRKLIGSRAIMWKDSSVSLNKQYVWVDYWEIEQKFLKPGKPTNFEDAIELEKIKTLYQGQLLPREDQHWLIGYRNNLHRKCIKLLVEQSQKLLDRGKLSAAIEIANIGQSLDVEVEEFYQIEINAYLKQGDSVSAKHAYQRCTERLFERLGRSPSSSTSKLFN